MSALIPQIIVYSPTETTETISNSTKRSCVGTNSRIDVTIDSNDFMVTKNSVNSLEMNKNKDSKIELSAGNDTKSGIISWDNTFHMRNMNLMNFGTNYATNRSSYRSHNISIHRQRMGGTTSTAKSLNILRQTLQHTMNREINEVIQKYLDRFFRPAIENIRNNNGVNAVSEQHIQCVCRQILEEAKKMYFAGVLTRSNSPMAAMSGVFSNNGDNLSDNENNNPIPESRIGRNKRNKESDSDSETSSLNTLKPISSRKKVSTSKHSSNTSNTNTSHSDRWTPTSVRSQMSAKANQSEAMKKVKRDSRKWDPKRLSTQTKFVLGSRANKALGFGTTRGRLYTKHADLFRYIGDHEDKQWLHDNHLMPPAGGRAYLLIKEDILDLIESDEYKNAQGVNANDMGEGFTVPESMIIKMATVMEHMRNSEMSRKKIETKSRTLAISSLNSMTLQSITDNSNTNQSNDNPNESAVEVNRPESAAISPTDDLEILSAAEIPSTDPSPFSIGASCFESDISPNENQEISPIPSDISSTGNTLNDI